MINKIKNILINSGKVIYNIIKLPLPTEVGLSNNNALKLNIFELDDDNDSWDYYYKYCKYKYPIKYFINRTIPAEFRYYSTKLENYKYYIESRFINKDHLIDIRQSKDIDHINYYEYGYLESDYKILYSCFNIFVSFYENQYMKCNYDYNVDNNTEEYILFNSIYNYWKIDRNKLAQELEISNHNHWDYRESLRNKNRTDEDNEFLKTLTDNSSRLKNEFEIKENEMLELLIKNRNKFWT